jgi:multifunctional 2-oxoglutarate metabolism enzyme
VPDQPSNTDPLAAFGPNEWLVDELYQQYQQDKESVDKAWWEFFEDYQPGDGGANGRTSPAGAGTAAPAAQGSERPVTQEAARPAPQPAAQTAAPAARAAEPAPKPAAGAAPVKPAATAPEPSNTVAEGQQGGDTPTPITREAPAKKTPGPLNENEVKPLRGASARVVTTWSPASRCPPPPACAWSRPSC